MKLKQMSSEKHFLQQKFLVDIGDIPYVPCGEKSVCFLRVIRDVCVHYYVDLTISHPELHVALLKCDSELRGRRLK